MEYTTEEVVAVLMQLSSEVICQICGCVRQCPEEYLDAPDDFICGDCYDNILAEGE